MYAVGRPELNRKGRWLAAVLACGEGAALSHGSAAALWGIGEYERGEIEVSVPRDRIVARAGIRVRRRSHLGARDITTRRGIPVTSPMRTVIDLAPRLGRAALETAINEGIDRELFSLAELRAELEERAGERGVAPLRFVLDRRGFRLTRSHLERLFLPLAEQAGLSTPETRVWLNGFEVDFFFRELGLVVETDGLRFHRTPSQQARDHLRDQAHTAAGLTTLRFTHEQIRYEPSYVISTLRRTAAHLVKDSGLDMGPNLSIRRSGGGGRRSSHG